MRRRDFYPTPEQLARMTPAEREELTRLLVLREVNLRENPLAAYEPTPKQEAGHKSHHKIISYFGANRAGKTTFGAAETVWSMLGEHPYKRTPAPPVKWWAVSKEIPIARGEPHVQLDKLVSFIPPKALRGGNMAMAYSVGARTLYLENGSYVVLKSYAQDVVQFSGDDIDGVWFDEEPPRPIFIECMMRLIDRGGRALLTMTPDKGMTYVYDEVYLKANLPGSHIFAVTVGMEDNPHLDPAEIEIASRGLTDEEKQVKIHGRFVRRAGLVYKEFDPLLHVLQANFTPPPSWNWVMAVDPGINNPTAVLWAAVSPDDVLYIVDEHYEAGRTARHHAGMIKAIERDLGVKRILRVIDPYGFTRSHDARSWSDEYREQGLHFRPANNKVQAGINQVMQRMEIITDEKGNKRTRLYVNPRCENLIREITQEYEWRQVSAARAAMGFSGGDKPFAKGNDCCDCLRYIAMTKPLPPRLAAPTDREKAFQQILDDRRMRERRIVPETRDPWTGY